MKIIFISGPYFGSGQRKEIERNIRNAEKYQIALSNQRVPFFCSHNHTEHFEEKSTAPEEFYKSIDMEILKRACDGVLAIPGWERSSGAKEEIALAKRNNLPVFFPKSPEDLKSLITFAKN